ncbi:MAG: 6,7-dimethyl-8-ribityllumazine synthase [Dehalococcoidia bacterium]|nr:6,7-dimethyl-8-ribityllumazine synthase [Dehalococcoidia bacterium]
MPTGGFQADDHDLDGSRLRIAIACARFNGDITQRLLEGCIDELRRRGVTEARLTVQYVPGCFELPLMAKIFGSRGEFDAIICLGAVIRGDTPHFEYVSSATAIGIQQAALETRVPVAFGVLTVDNEQQAYDRVGGAAGHKGREAALSAIEMAHAVGASRGTDV